MTVKHDHLWLTPTFRNYMETSRFLFAVYCWLLAKLLGPFLFPQAIAPYIPRGNVKLSSALYEMVLFDFLKKDYKVSEVKVDILSRPLFLPPPI